jgi:hypothetical protein
VLIAIDDPGRQGPLNLLSPCHVALGYTTSSVVERMSRHLNIAVEGCCHGELDRIYQTIQESEEKNGIHVDLLLICGDFECLRDVIDLDCLAVPEKYRKMVNARLK